MQNKNKSKQSQLLDFLSQHTSHDTMFTALTLQEAKFSMTSEMIWLFLTYLQLASQIFLLTLNLWSSAPPGNSISWFIISTLKLINPGSLFVSEGDKEVIWSLLIISLVIALSRYMVFLYILCSLILKMECSPIFIKVWKIAFQLQGRALYSILLSVWVNIIVMAFYNELAIPGFEKTGTVILMIGFLIIEFMFCLVLQLRYFTVLPTKSLLSSKSPVIEAITLTQKFVLQILQIIFASISYLDDWVIISVCLLSSVIRNAVYFKTLPMYSLRGLQYQGGMLMVITSLDIACFFQKIALPENPFNFVMILWIILSSLLIRTSYMHIYKRMIALALGQGKNISSDIIQKINIIKQLRSSTGQSNNISKDRYLYLVKSTIRQTLICSLQVKSKTKDIIDFDPDSKDALYEMVINYLESAQAVFPKDKLLKLYIAGMWAKKRLYGLSMSILTNLQHSSDRVIAINAALLILKIQETMKAKSTTTDSKMNIHDYVKSQVQYIQIEKKILQQTDLQLELYEEMTKDNPDLSKIFDQGQKLEKCRQTITKRIDFIMNNAPESYISPLLVCTYYYLINNHSGLEFSKSLKTYSQRKVKYAKSYEDEHITPENSYQEKNAFLLVSGQKESLGKICFCTESLAEIYGGDISFYLGADVSAIASLDCPNFDLMRSAAAQKSESVIRQRFQGYCHHKTGYPIRLEFYIDVFPFLVNGFYYCILIRPLSTEEPILMNSKEKSILDDPEKEAPRITENVKTVNEKNKPQELGNVRCESNFESMESEHVEKDYVKNSTVWKPDAMNKEMTGRYQDINALDLLSSPRTEAGLLTKYDGSARKLNTWRYMKKKPDAIDSQDESQENYKKNNNNKFIDEKNRDKILENPEHAIVSQTLKLALATKFYWRPLKIAYSVFYLLLLVIVVAQVIIKNELDNSMNDLKTEKDILLNAQNRDYAFVNIARLAGFIVDEVTGVFNASTVSSFGLSRSYYLSNVNTNLLTLIEANQNIQTNAGLLAPTLRETLFEEDIRIYKCRISTKSLETSNNMTNFQATDDLSQSLLKGLMVAKTNINQTVDLINFVVNNSLNALLLKTESTTQLITDSIESDTKEKRRLTEINFIVFTVDLTIMSLALLRIIFLIYSKEKSNMLTLIKLDPNAINKLRSSLNRFKKLIETGSLTEDKDTLHTLQKLVLEDFNRKYGTRKNFHSAKYGGTIKKYLILAAKCLLCNYAVVSLIGWSSFSASNSIQSLHTEQLRLTFAKEISKTNLVTYAAFRQLYSTLGTAKIRDEFVGTQLSSGIDNISAFRTGILSAFKNTDGEYDSLIGKIIFGPNCTDLITASSIGNCNYLLNNQKQIGLISLLSDYEGLLTSLNNSYYSSNKTVEALRALQTQNFDLFVSTFRTVLDETNSIANRTNVIFQEEFDKSLNQAEVNLIVISILISIFAYGAWIFIFKQLRESDNKFKTLLKNYPTNLLLSNYLLKTYLVKASGSALDPIRSYL